MPLYYGIAYLKLELINMICLWLLLLRSSVTLVDTSLYAKV